MPQGPAATAQTAETVRHTVRLRLHPGDAATDIQPAACGPGPSILQRNPRNCRKRRKTADSGSATCKTSDRDLDLGHSPSVGPALRGGVRLGRGPRGPHRRLK